MSTVVNCMKLFNSLKRTSETQVYLPDGKPVTYQTLKRARIKITYKD